MRPLTRLAALALLTTSFAACAPADEAATDAADDTSAPEPSAAEDCTPDTMETIADATLTIATDDPAYSPWFVDNDPTNGEGYEAAVGYAIAEQLGYSEDQVSWVKVGFNSSYAPGPKS
ncbi:MAG: amino acid ABC transporter substrate-binding protein, partial [Nocardioides sp.]|nr:amino acid ABC transporter substrate-binding protein [Nocardioides sp.]